MSPAGPILIGILVVAFLGSVVGAVLTADDKLIIATIFAGALALLAALLRTR